jgi:hypothetical protein
MDGMNANKQQWNECEQSMLSVVRNLCFKIFGKDNRASFFQPSVLRFTFKENRALGQLFPP